MFDPTTCYDVAVLGGGLCGFAAARQLAQGGARVALVARRPVLGWETTWAFHPELGEPASDTALWLAETMTARGGCRDGRLDPPIADLVLDRGAADAGLDLLLYAQPVAVSCREGRVTGVLLGTKAGEIPLRARAFVDATENGLVWRLAGGDVAPPASPVARQTLFLNNVPDGLIESARSLGDLDGLGNVDVAPSLWPGEIAVAFGLDACDIRTARGDLPDVLRVVREECDLPDAALVTAVGCEPYPLTIGRASGDAAPASNLFAAAPWAAEPADGVLSVAERLGIGDAAAARVQAALPSLPAVGDDEPLAHSQVAPPAHRADVVVCGGGTGGAFAAIAAARQGASTVLLDAGTSLGGVGTGGGIHSYYHGVKGGLQDEADTFLEELTPLFGPPEKVNGFHPWAKQVVLELMAAEAGVEIAYDTMVTGVRTAPVPSALPAAAGDRSEAVRRITGVVGAGPEGNALYEAKVFVDGTGDGDVAAMAG
ncbi:FAD-dependent oxidoreductase, partial [bacterium]|nr:FAD-dependent oxidoreductase [bacterium]